MTAQCADFVAPRFRRIDGWSNISQYMRVRPWPHLVLDNFLENQVFASGLQDIEVGKYDFEVQPRGNGRIEFAVLKSEILWRALYSSSVMLLLYAAFGKKVSLNKQNLIQVRQMDNTTPRFPLHNDFVEGSDHIVVMLYLSRGWTRDRGGRLELYRDEGGQKPVARIAPLANRLVAFHAKKTYWHAVEKVRNWRRINLVAAWTVDE